MIASEGQTEHIRPELLNKPAARVGRYGDAEAFQGYASMLAHARVVGEGHEVCHRMAEDTGGVNALLAVVIATHKGLARRIQPAMHD